jgi:hypothetical protein
VYQLEGMEIGYELGQREVMEWRGECSEVMDQRRGIQLSPLPWFFRVCYVTEGSELSPLSSTARSLYRGQLEFNCLIVFSLNTICVSLIPRITDMAQSRPLFNQFKG